MGIDAEEEEAFGYFKGSDISAIVQTHDDNLGKTPINLEATIIHLVGGESFYIPLHIDEVVERLSENKTS